jgi:hypothetical protein
MNWFGLFVGCTFIFIYVELFTLFHSGNIKPPASGKSQPISDLSQYGFGPHKQLVVFNVSVDNIEMSDKIYAPMAWNSTKKPSLDWIDNGIEIKGSGPNERRKLNWAFEIWTAADDDVPCTSPETCEDDKAELFDFGEDYEDYVLRGGFLEPTLVRDTVPSMMQGGILQHTLVDVVFFNNDEYTYEGTYILYPAIQRRVLEKRLDWDEKGKAKDCDKVDTASMIAEYTNPTNNRKQPCEEFDLQVKMRYPKCDMDACFHDRTNTFFSVLTNTNTSEVALDMQSFADTFLMEAQIMNCDFPYSSQYFYIDPDESMLHSGPRWDFDCMGWRSTAFSWNYYNQFSTPVPLWIHLGKYAPFIHMVNTQKNNTLSNNYAVVQSVIDERKNQTSMGYFDNNIERWDPFGKRYVHLIEQPMYLNDITKNTMKEELVFMETRMKERYEWLQENTFVEAKVGSLPPYIVTLLVLGSFSATLVLVSIGWGTYLACKRGDYEVLNQRDR